MKQIFMMLLMACANAVMATGTVVVKSVEAQQRYPWNGLVDIVVTLEGTADDVAEVGCTFAATNSATHAAVPVISVTQKGCDTSSGTTCTRRYIWNATADVGTIKIDDLALAVDVRVLGGVQLWENGPYWAECNVGATKPEEFGYHFWWGDTVGYRWTYKGWVSVKDGAAFSFSFGSGNCPTYDKSNAQLQSAGYIDSTCNLVAAHDAATVHLGTPWRMPTATEIDALISNCDTTWTTRGGVDGYLVIGRGAFASKSIFLPAAGFGDNLLKLSGSHGFYWSSTPKYSDCAWFLDFKSSIFRRYCYEYFRCYGQSVRPLREFVK